MAVTNITSSETLYNVEGFSPLKGLIQTLTFTWPDAAHPGRLLPGQAATASFDYTIPPTFPDLAAQPQAVWAWVTADDSDPVDGAFVAARAFMNSTGLDVVGPGVTVGVSASATTAAVGDTVTVNITVSNNAQRDDSVSDLVVTDLLTGQTHELTPAGSLAPGLIATAHFTYTVQAADIPLISVQVTAAGHAASSPEIAVYASGRTSISVSAATVPTGPNLELATTAAPALLLRDESMALPIAVGNTGDQGAADVTLRLTLPIGVDLVDLGLGGDSSSYDPNTRRITWIWTGIANGVSMGVSPRVQTTLPAGAELVFDVSASTTAAETDYADNTAALTLPGEDRTPTNAALAPVDRGWLVADGQDSIQLRLTALDQLGRAMPNVAGTVFADAPGTTFDPATFVTDASGEATFTVRATEVGVVTVSARLDGQVTATRIPSPSVRPGRRSA